MNNLIIAATGLDGLVGSRIRELLKDEFEFLNLHEHMMDITDRENTFSVINDHNFDIFLHLAAFTNVDACEEKKDIAWKVNVEGTKNVYDAVQKKRKHFMFMSTGFVFDGEDPPYYEDSEENPISYYGKTKYEGEKVVKENGLIIRIDYPYGGHVDYKKDIVESLVDLLKTKKPFSGVVDQVFTPTYIDDIAFAIRHLAQNFKPEIYHIVGADPLSGYDVVQTIGKVYGLDTSHVTQTTYDKFYKGKAQRPKNSFMKSKNNDFYTMKTFEEGLLDLKNRVNL